jgi:flagellar basal body-associated protein FliL
VSKALTDGKITDAEFEVIIREMQKYRDLKSQIRRRVRTELSSEQEAEIRTKAEKKVQEIALTNLQSILSHSGKAPFN